MSLFSFNFFLDTRKTFNEEENPSPGNKIHPISVSLYDRTDKKNYHFRLKRVQGKDMRCTPIEFKSIWGEDRYKKTALGDLGAETTIFGNKKFLRDVLKLNTDILNEIIERPEVSLWTDVKAAFNNHNRQKVEVSETNSLYDAIDSFIETLEHQERFKYANTFKTAKNNIQEFNGDKDLLFTDITVKWLNSYDRKRRKTVSASSVRNDVVCIRTVYNIAKKKNAKLLELYPFGTSKDGKYPIPDGEGTNRGLTKEDLKKIQQFSSDNWYHQNARDYFMLSYYSRGMNLKDLALIKKGQTNYVRSKTKYTTKTEVKIDFKLNDEMREIVSRNAGHGKYLLDIIDDKDSAEVIQNKVNRKLSSIAKQLKQIAKILDLPSGFSYQWAKHTVGTNLARSNVNINTIREVFGHTDIKTTIKYINSLKDEQESEINNALEI